MNTPHPISNYTSYKVQVIGMANKTVLLALGLMLFIAQPSAAQEQVDQAQAVQGALELFAAYQSGYFQVVAVSCFQLYSTSGIIASDFEAGVVDGVLAQQALERSRLLLSVCTTSLAQIKVATPLGDTAAHDELLRLAHLLDKLVGLFDAMDNKFIYPSEENLSRADKALAELDYAMEQYTSPSQE